MAKKFFFTVFFIAVLPSLVTAAQFVQSSMVKIYTVQDQPNYANPWNFDGPNSVSGSGAVISGQRILTNAHVVSNQTFIQVRAHGKAKKFEANVLAVSHEADLAVLKVKDPAFFADIKPLEIGDLPETQQPIVVCGFPTGGDTLSMTTGVVSRIEHQQYVHSYLNLLAIQVDAAVNSGNSGGPAISEDLKIVGVAMETLKDAENIAYLIPPPIIKHFLKDIEDGHYDGFPILGIRTQNIENTALKEKLGLKKNMAGTLVTKVVSGCSAQGHLKEGDVILKVGNLPVAGDQTIEFRPHERTHYNYAIQQLQLGEVIDLEIFRDKKLKKVSVPLNSKLGDDLIIKAQWDKPPRYFIYGGIVFNPLTINYLGCWGDEWQKDAPKDMQKFLQHNCKDAEKEEIVVLNKVLPIDQNAGYHDISDEIVVSINGHKILRLDDIVKVIEESEFEFAEIKTYSNNHIVLKRIDVEGANGSILKQYRITSDRSEDFM
jgi:S1-C subfamily serine protease